MPRIRQEVTFDAPPRKVYEALMDSVQHARFTGEAAQISGEGGGAFSAYGGKVGGRNIDLVPDRRIVQAWRSNEWPEGVYSMVRFDLRGEGGKTLLTFEQDAIPEGAEKMLEPGWKAMYWDKLSQHLSR